MIGGENWRHRLTAAVRASGIKYAVIPYVTGLTPETITRVLTAEHQRPPLHTVAIIVHAVGTTVGYVLGESDMRALRAFIEYLEHFDRRVGGTTK